MTLRHSAYQTTTIHQVFTRKIQCLRISHLPALVLPWRKIMPSFCKTSKSRRMVIFATSSLAANSDNVIVGFSAMYPIMRNCLSDNFMCSFMCSFICPFDERYEFLALTIFSSSLTCISSGCSTSCGSNQCFSCHALRMRGNPEPRFSP